MRRLTKALLVAIIFLLLLSTLACAAVTETTTIISTSLTTSMIPTSSSLSTPISTISSSSTPAVTPGVPTQVNPNAGTVMGQVTYMDNSPAFQDTVVIFAQGSYVSLDTTFTNAAGNYTFSDLPVGSYEIYAGIYKDYSLSTPDATASVGAQQVTQVPLIRIPREVDEISCNGVKLSNYPQASVSMGQMNFSWSAVPTAYDYWVTVTGPSDYYVLYTSISDTNVTWSPLEAGTYDVEIKAFNDFQMLVGAGSENFIVNP